MVDRTAMYLVAVPTGDVRDLALQIQSWLNSRYRLFNDSLPPIHMTVERLRTEGETQLERAFGVIEEVCRRHRPFEIETFGFTCFGPPYKSVNLGVVRSAHLNRLSLDLSRSLGNEGFEVREDVSAWDFHISLANPHFADREWGVREYEEACAFIQSVEVRARCVIHELELWHPWYRPFLSVERVFRMGNGCSSACQTETIDLS